jgi:hypothetical protein
MPRSDFIVDFLQVGGFNIAYKNAHIKTRIENRAWETGVWSLQQKVGRLQGKNIVNETEVESGWGNYCSIFNLCDNFLSKGL